MAFTQDTEYLYDKKRALKDLLSMNPAIQNSEMNSVQEKADTLEQYFSLDFAVIPDKTFLRRPDEVNEDGSIVENYSKQLPLKLFGLFENILVLKFPGKHNKNLVFNCPRLPESEISKVKDLVNNLFLLYGRDEWYMKGAFELSDVLEIKSGHWSGRMWIHKRDESPFKYERPLMISYDKVHDGLSLTLFLNH
jgi:hypothetical protein